MLKNRMEAVSMNDFYFYSPDINVPDPMSTIKHMWCALDIVYYRNNKLIQLVTTECATTEYWANLCPATPLLCIYESEKNM